jgi:glycerophosphoryl diester phosphodiesterase
MPVNGIRILAHRGARITSCENTLEAFQRAREEGADAVECDLRLTRDGEPILFHDEDARRVAGSPRRLRDMAWNEVSELRVFGRCRIPHLRDALEFMAGWPSGEIFFDLHEESLKLVEAVVSSIASSGLIERCFLLDFYSNRRLLLHARSLNGRIGISVMPGAPWNIQRSVRELRPRSLCLGWDVFLNRLFYRTACLFHDPRPAIAWAKAAGVPVGAGIANTALEIRYFLAQGATGIWTDDLILTKQELAKRPSG